MKDLSFNDYLSKHLCFVLMYLYMVATFPFWHLKACHHHDILLYMVDMVIKKKEHAISLAFCREELVMEAKNVVRVDDVVLRQIKCRCMLGG